MQNNVQNMQKRHQRTTPPPNLLFRSVLTYVLVWWHTREPYLASDGWTNLHPVNAFRFYNPNRTPTESKEQRTEGPKKVAPTLPRKRNKKQNDKFLLSSSITSAIYTGRERAGGLPLRGLQVRGDHIFAYFTRPLTKI